jgi:tight adherence protein B
VGGAVVVLAGGAGWLVAGPVLAVTVSLYSGVALWWGSAALRRRRTARTRMACADALAGLADDLRAGATVQNATIEAMTVLARVGDARRLEPVLRAARGGGDVVGALRAVRSAEEEPLRRLAAVYCLTEAGAPLSALIDRLDAELQAERRIALLLASETASARTTALILAGLPVAGLAVGVGMGTNPLQVLLHTVPGGLCFLAAAVLHVLGLVWTDRIVALPVFRRSFA